MTVPAECFGALDLTGPSGEGRVFVAPEVKERASVLGGDLPKTLDFISKELATDFYAGAMRGPRGVLLSRGGNFTDKSLLLAKLLTLGNPGYEVRFAFCDLPPDKAASLISNGKMPANAPTVLPAPKASGGSPTSETLALAKQFIGALRASIAQVGTDSEVISAALRAGHVSLESPVRSIDVLADTVRPHIWVQLRAGTEWVDLDPAVGVVGRSLCSADQTASALPEKTFHHIGIGVILEQRQAGKLTTQTLLEAVWRTADLAGSTVSYLNPEALGVKSLTANNGPDIAGSERFTPILVVDDQYAAGVPFYLPQRKASQPLQAATGGAFDVFSRALSPPSEPSPAAPATIAGDAAAGGTVETTSLWLAFYLSRPDGTEERVQRPIFDRIGYVARAYGEEATAPLDPMETDHGAYWALARMQSVGVWTGEIVPPRLANESKAPYDRILGALEGMAAINRAFHAYRDLLFRMQANSDVGIDMISPSVALLSANPVEGNLTLDRIADSETWLRGTTKKGIGAGIIWGVASLEAERLAALTPQLGSSAMDASSRDLLIHDTASVFHAAAHDKGALLIFGESDKNRAFDIEASDEARVRLYNRLQGGQLALVPARAISREGRLELGWWIIDATTGLIHDEFETGGHQAAVESAEGEGNAAEEEEEARQFECEVAGSSRRAAVALVTYVILAITAPHIREAMEEAGMAGEDAAVKELADGMDEVEKLEQEECEAPPSGSKQHGQSTRPSAPSKPTPSAASGRPPRGSPPPPPGKMTPPGGRGWTPSNPWQPSNPFPPGPGSVH